MTIFQTYIQLSSLPKNLQQKVLSYILSLQKQTKRLTNKQDRTPGLAKGLIKMKDNFDDPIEDFKGFM